MLYRLKNAGFQAYLVGGAVRDLLLEIIPKDFDIATDAHPEEVRKLFRNCILIGKRFRLAHIRFGAEIIEVATFRAHQVESSGERQHSEHGMILRDNVYGTIEEDVWRRDFTVNALYYNIQDFSLVDYVGGMDDLKAKLIRMLGDPVVRYHEDPVRMLRAVRLAAKLNFQIEPKTAAPITKLIGLLQNVPEARIFDEISKWFYSGASLRTFMLLRQYGIFAVLFPKTEGLLAGVNADLTKAFLWHGFNDTDQRLASDKPVNLAFLFAVLLWYPLQEEIALFQEEDLHPYEVMMHAMREVLRREAEHILLPQYLRLTIKEIWVLQYRLEQMRKNKTAHVLSHPKFRAAYDFLLLRAKAGEKVQEVVDWWSGRK
ncbi:MAG: polynucleotide adenylyltransferase PcnB [Gammaproteobacteria bacterium]|nr:polynucleotide adenylyltransferase PcnB [Gammaproteobacteria bacterium]